MGKYYGIRLKEETYKNLLKIKAKIMAETGEHISFDEIINLLILRYEGAK